MAISNISNKGVHNTGSDIRTANTSKQSGSESIERSQGSGADRVSLTGSTTQIKALETQIANQPVVNASHVSQVQHLLATGSYDFEPIDAADSMIEQEKAFAMSESSNS